MNILLLVLAASGNVTYAKEIKSRGPNRFRESRWWKNGYQNWIDEEFKNHLRLNRQTFELVLSIATHFILKQLQICTCTSHILHQFLTFRVFTVFTLKLRHLAFTVLVVVLIIKKNLADLNIFALYCIYIDYYKGHPSFLVN